MSDIPWNEEKGRWCDDSDYYILYTDRKRLSAIKDFNVIAVLHILNRLDLGGTNIGDVSALSGLSGLQSLDLSSTQVGDVSALSGLTGLMYLKLCDTQVGDVSALSGLTGLQSLDLSSTQVGDASALSGLTGLQSLDLSSTQVGDVSALSGLTGLQSLDLSSTQVGDVSALSGLTGLQSLNLGATQVSDVSDLSGLIGLRSLCLSVTQVSDVSPLSDLRELQSLDLNSTLVSDSDVSCLIGLTGLESLDLSDTQVSDVRFLIGLTGLQSLDLSSTHVSDVSALSCLTGLRSLSIWSTEERTASPEWVLAFPLLKRFMTDRLKTVPRAVLSRYFCDDCLERLRIWNTDCQPGAVTDREVKVFVLGNGTAGKTQICRALMGERYDNTVPSTHGIQVRDLSMAGLTGEEALAGRLWDFGGQDIYHGTHALFMEGRAVFLLVWTPELEAAGGYVEKGLPMHHHGLDYWLDYVKSLAGKDAAIVLVQAKCDAERSRQEPVLPGHLDFTRPIPKVTCSAKAGHLEEVKAALASASRYLIETHGTYLLPQSWVRVRESLRQLRDEEKRRTLKPEEFETLCIKTCGTSVPKSLLHYFHETGEVFWNEKLFEGEIVLDKSGRYVPFMPSLTGRGCVKPSDRTLASFSPLSSMNGCGKRSSPLKNSRLC